MLKFGVLLCKQRLFSDLKVWSLWVAISKTELGSIYDYFNSREGHQIIKEEECIIIKDGGAKWQLIDRNEQEVTRFARRITTIRILQL